MPSPSDALAIGRFRALDGLRGIAALIVVVRHTLGAIDMPLPTRRNLIEGPFGLIANAQGACARRPRRVRRASRSHFGDAVRTWTGKTRTLRTMRSSGLPRRARPTSECRSR